jgi:photosystem II stability/assembly factor-like uncharacterized protein
MMKEMAMAVEQGAPRQPRWQEQNSGTKARLRGVSAVGENVVWASGSNGTFVTTTDGGAHWKADVVAGAADLDFRDVHGVDPTTAYLLSAGEGEKSRIYKTSDGGKSWNLQFKNTDPAAFFDGFAFWDARNGVAFSDPVGGRFLSIRTADGGTTWTDIPRENMPAAVPGEAAFAASGSSIAVAGRDHVWIATGGSAARVFHSEDRGLTWATATTPIVMGTPSAGIFSIFAINVREVLVAGGDYQKENEANVNFAKSLDGGRTWTVGPQLPGYRSAIVAAKDGYIAVGPSGTDVMPPIGGSWSKMSDVGYDALSFVPGTTTGWAVGQGGRIAKWMGK